MRKFNFVVLGGLFLCMALWVGNWSENITLRERLERAEENLGKMKAEHELALSAANEAMRAREEISVFQRQKLCEAEKALGNNPDYCNQPLPDDLRLFFQNEDDSFRAPGSALDGH